MYKTNSSLTLALFTTRSIDWFTTYPCINVCYDSSDFRDTLYDQIGSEHVPVDVNERVSSCFWCDSCCMTKYDQITSGVSHRPITEGTSESSSRNYVILLIFNFLIFVNLKKCCIEFTSQR
jgi:hypothetical protein